MNTKSILKALASTAVIVANISTVALADVSVTNIGTMSGDFAVIPNPQRIELNGQSLGNTCLTGDVAEINGKEYLFALNQSGITVYDVTDKRAEVKPVLQAPNDTNGCYATTPYSTGSSTENQYFSIQNPDQVFSFGALKINRASDGNTYLYYSCIVTDDTDTDGIYESTDEDHHAPCIRKINITDPLYPVDVKTYRGKVTSNYAANAFRYNYIQLKDDKIYAFGVDYKGVHNNKPSITMFDETTSPDENDGFYYPAAQYDEGFGNAICDFYGDKFARVKPVSNTVRISVGQLVANEETGKTEVVEVVNEGFGFDGNFRDKIRGIAYNGKYVFLSVKNISGITNGLYVYEPTDSELILKTIITFGNDVPIYYSSTDSITEVKFDRIDIIEDTLYAYTDGDKKMMLELDVSNIYQPTLLSMNINTRYLYAMFATEDTVWGLGGDTLARHATSKSNRFSASDYGANQCYIRPSYYTYNKGSEELDYTAIVAVYDTSGRLVKVINKTDYKAPAETIIAGTDQGRVNAWFSDLKDDLNFKTYTFKTYMWNSIEGMKPLMKEITDIID